MKRHEALQDLSREHHLALKLALHGRRAIASGDPGQITAAANACAVAFSSELEPHFVREETDLLPMLAQAGETALVQRTLDEHAELRSLAARLLDADVAALERFAELLGAHVRFEEQELFEAAQTCLDLDRPEP